MQPRYILGPMVILAGLALSGSPARGENPQDRQPVRPPPAPATWTAAPGKWVEMESAEITDPHGTVWRVEVAGRRIGTLSGETREVEVRTPRVRIRQVADAETLAVAVLLPIDNTAVAIFPPGSKQESFVPSELGEDRIARWPNLCNISLLDVTGDLDIDADGVPEVALRRFCSCSAEGCSGITLLELDPDGPDLLDPASLVDEIYLGDLTLDHIEAGEYPSRPLLRVSLAYLEDCRFIAAAGIRGASDCPGCCYFPVLLRPVDGGSYETYYDRAMQQKLLGRARVDLSRVAARSFTEPLAPYEKTYIARAASFFYLTGTGAETRSVVLEGLGPREIDFRIQELAVRIDRFFRPEERSRD